MIELRNEIEQNVMAYRNSSTLYASVGSWILEAGLWTLNSERRTLDTGRWTLEATLWTLDAGHWTPDAILWTLGFGHWTLLLTGSA